MKKICLYINNDNKNIKKNDENSKITTNFHNKENSDNIKENLFNSKTFILNDNQNNNNETEWNEINSNNNKNNNKRRW